MGQVSKHIARVGEDRVCTSIIVAAELRYGATKKASRQLTQRVNDALEILDVRDWEPPADALYGNLRTKLDRSGRTMGANDMLIAAQVLALGLILVTDNRREFIQVSDLRIENWLRDET